MNLKGVSQAILTRLNGYAALTSITNSIGRIRLQDDQAEDVSNFPFTVFDDVDVRPWDTKTSDGGRQLVQVTTYARATGSNSAADLALSAAQATYDALHKYALPISGSNTVNVLFDSSPGLMVDPDGVTMYQPMTFVIVYDDGS